MKTIDDLLQFLKTKNQKELSSAVGSDTANFLVRETNASTAPPEISKPVQDEINKNYADIQKLADPPEATNNILTPELQKQIEQTSALLQNALSGNLTLTPDVLKLIESTFNDIQKLAQPSEKILTQDTIQRINDNDATIQLGNVAVEGTNNILVDNKPQSGFESINTQSVIDKNDKDIRESQDPNQEIDNILVDGKLQSGFETINTQSTIDKNWKQIEQGKEPIEGTNNILVGDTLTRIDENWKQIEQGKEPIEGTNNILVDDTLLKIANNWKEIKKGQEPIEGTNNILVDDTLARIDENWKKIEQGKEPIEGTNNILVDDTLSRIDANWSQIERGKEPVEGTNNILVDDTLARIDENWKQIEQGKEPFEGTNNILVDGLNKKGFESIDTQSTIDKNWAEIEQGKEPFEGTNNILVDGLNKKGFESINTQTKIDENWAEIERGKEPIEGTNNVLVDGLNKKGFESINTQTKIDENWKEIEKGKEPFEGTNNVLVDGKEQKGFESINTQSTIDKNWAEIEKGKEPVEGTNNVLVDGKEQKGFESINTQSTINKNWSEIEKGKEPIEGTNNVLVGGLQKKGFESIDTQKRIDENWKEIEKGKEPVEGTNNVLVDNKEQKGFESINTQTTINKNWSEIEKGKEPVEGTNNVLVDHKDQKGFESINTQTRIDDNWKEIEKGKEPIEGTNNVLVDKMDKKGFESINTQTRIDDNWKEIEKGKEPTQGTDNILVSKKEQKGFEQIDTVGTIDDNWSKIELGKEPTQGTDNILVDKKEQVGFHSIDTRTRIDDNWSKIELGKEPTQGTDNILVSKKDQQGFEQIDTLGTIDDNWSKIELGKQPVEGINNISNSDSNSLRTDLHQKGFIDPIDYYAKIDEQKRGLADKGNYWNYSNEMPQDNSHIVFDMPNQYRFNKDTFRYASFLKHGKTILGDFNEEKLQITYLSSHHGNYDVLRDKGSLKDNVKGRVYGSDDTDQTLVNRPFSVGSFDRESLILRNLETMGYYIDYDRAINRTANIEAQYSIADTFEKGKPTGFDQEGHSKYRNYFVRNRSEFKNEYGQIRYSLDPLSLAKRSSFSYDQFNAQSMVQPQIDENGQYFYAPVTYPLNDSASNHRLYENTPVSISDITTYPTDPQAVVNNDNRIRQFLKLRTAIQEQMNFLNKFGEHQHDLFEYSRNFTDVPSMTWLSQDIRIEDFRYYQLNKDMVSSNPANYNFGNVKKYEGTDGQRRQIDYYRNNPEISFALETMRLMYLGNPRNAQIFDPISMFWHKEGGRTGAVDVRKDLRLLGGAPKTYYEWHRPAGLIEALANASGGKAGQLLGDTSSFIETGFDIITGGSENYTKNIYGSDGIIWAELGNPSQIDLTNPVNILSRSLDIASQFINPAAFTLLSDVDRYMSGFGDSILRGMGEVVLKAKLGMALGQLAGSEFRVMKGRNTLTSGQQLFGSGPLTLNNAMEFITNIAGNKVDNLDWFDGASSYHEYLTDPRVWNADQRIMWHNMAARYKNAPEKESENESSFGLDPVQIGKNILKKVGINLDNPFANNTDTMLMQMYKELATTQDQYTLYKTMDMHKFKREAIQQTEPDEESGIRQNDTTRAYMQDRTAISTRPDWFREKLTYGGMEYEIKEKATILKDYALDTNFKPSVFPEWADDKRFNNDGNMQYVYDKNASTISPTMSGREIKFDSYDYIGTVKRAIPDINKIVEDNKAELQKEQSAKNTKAEEKSKKKKKKLKVSGTFSDPNDGSAYASAVENDLKTTFAGSSFQKVADYEWIGEVSSPSAESLKNLETRFSASCHSLGNTSTWETSISDASSEATTEDDVSQEESSRDDKSPKLNEAEVEARGGAAPVSVDALNELFNEIDPQIFRFWMRTISRTHYEVTPEVYYLNDSNKIALARPRYTGHSAIFFDAILKSINENISPSWQSQSFFGRTEDIHTWQATSRTLQFTTSFVVSSPSQLPAMRAKVQELIRMCYPQIQTIRGVGVLAYRSGPIVELAIGDMWRTFGFINSMSVNWGGGTGEPVWELSKYGQIIRAVDLTIDIQILHKELPHAGTEFYAESFNPDVFYYEQEQGTAIKTTSGYLRKTNKYQLPKSEDEIQDANSELPSVTTPPLLDAANQFTNTPAVSSTEWVNKLFGSSFGGA